MQMSDEGAKDRRPQTNLVNEVNHGPDTSRHERDHHPLILMPCRKMSLHKQNDREWKCGACDIKLPIRPLKNKPYELNRESDPEEDIELDETFVDLIVGVHLLDPPISA